MKPGGEDFIPHCLQLLLLLWCRCTLTTAQWPCREMIITWDGHLQLAAIRSLHCNEQKSLDNSCSLESPDGGWPVGLPRRATEMPSCLIKNPGQSPLSCLTIILLSSSCRLSLTYVPFPFSSFCPLPSIVPLMFLSSSQQLPLVVLSYTVQYIASSDHLPFSCLSP
jgi:hypothetical protein